MRKTRMITHAILIAAAVAFVGCAHTESRKEASRDKLIQRVNAYWDARIKDQVEAAYLMESPEARKRLPIYQYVKKTFVMQEGASRVAVKLVSMKILAVDLNGDRAKVTIQQNMRIGSPASERLDQNKAAVPQPVRASPPSVRQTNLALSIDEEWIRVKGDWYHDLKDSKDMTDIIVESYRNRRQPQPPGESK